VTRNSSTTGSRAAIAAGKTLANSSATKAERSAAGSALPQTPPTGSPRQTGPKAKAERTAAASALAQTPRRRSR
jgi:hypothetical protein